MRRLALMLLALLCSGCAPLYQQILAPYAETEKMYRQGGISESAQLMIDSAFAGFEGYPIVDHHVHFFGNNEATRIQGCDSLASLPVEQRPVLNIGAIKKQLPWYARPFVEAAALAVLKVDSMEQLNIGSAQRLLQLARWYGPSSYVDQPETSPYLARFMLYAFDGQYVNDAAAADQEALTSDSLAVVGNQYIVELVGCLNKKMAAGGGYSNNRFVAVGSINPFKQASGMVMRSRQVLQREVAVLKRAGVRWIKWRPASMNLNPENVAPWFYTLLREADIGILSHSGASAAIDYSQDLNELADPAKMEAALKNGVKVGLLHIGREGQSSEGQSYSSRFYELAASHGNQSPGLYGELSALPYDGTHKQLIDVVKTQHDIHYINGSDYPSVSAYPYVKAALNKLKRDGFIDKTKLKTLKEIYRYNPLLFDFVLKRNLSIGQLDGSRKKLGAKVFIAPNKY